MSKQQQQRQQHTLGAAGNATYVVCSYSTAPSTADQFHTALQAQLC
jgi:hypothetical protein